MAHSSSSLSPDRQNLVREMQRINFGRIDRLAVSSGEPQIGPHTSITREHKLAGENGPRPELSSEDFLLKQQVVELFEFFDELHDGVIDSIEIKHGLPFKLTFVEVPA